MTHRVSHRTSHRNDLEVESYDITTDVDPCLKRGFKGIDAYQIAFLFYHQFIQIATNTRDQAVKTLVPLGTSPDPVHNQLSQYNYLEDYIR